MPNTPTQRSTRSGSNAQAISLNDIKTLIESTKNETLEKVKEEIAKLHSIISPFLKKIEELEKVNEQLVKRISILEEKHHNIKEANAVSHSIQIDFLSESEDRLRRRNYLIVSGLQERKEGSIAERKAADVDLINDMARTIGIQKFSPLDAMRIGKVTQKPRLLRIKCSDFDEKMSLLRAATQLRRSTEFKQVFINPDLTKMQREIQRTLRMELRRRRDAGERVAIRGERIIEVKDQDFQ
jgi:archaellum component FlaC